MHGSAVRDEICSIYKIIFKFCSSYLLLGIFVNVLCPAMNH